MTVPASRLKRRRIYLMPSTPRKRTARGSAWLCAVRSSRTMAGVYGLHLVARTAQYSTSSALYANALQVDALRAIQLVQRLRDTADTRSARKVEIGFSEA